MRRPLRSPPAPFSGIADVEWASLEGASSQTAALTNDGRYFHWGSDDAYGPEPVLASTVPTQFGRGITWVDAGVGWTSVYGVSAEGGLFSMGAGSALGNGLSDARVGDLTQIAPGPDWVSVDPGGDFVTALTSDGQLYTWGSNLHGQLGHGPVGGSALLEPTRVTTPAVTWASVAAGVQHVLALTTDGQLYTWGWNDSGQLGHGNFGWGVGTPQLVSPPPGSTRWTTIWTNANGNNSFGATDTGATFAWGLGITGGLGVGDAVHHPSPTAVVAPAPSRVVLPAGQTTLGLDAAGALWGTGDNYEGLRGPVLNSQVTTFELVDPGPWLDASAGSGFAILMAGDRHLYGLGRDIAGTLGQGQTTPPPTDPWGFPEGTIHSAPIPVTRLPQTITVDRLVSSGQPVVGTTLGLGGLVSVDSAMRLEVTASGACAVAGSTVSFGSGGMCALSITQPGTSVFAPASIDVTVEVVGAPPTTICPLDTTTTSAPPGTPLSEAAGATTTAVPPCFRTAPRTLAFAG